MIWNKWKNVKVILQLPVGMIAWYFTVEDLSKADPVGAYILDSTVPQYAMVLHYSVSVILTWRCHSKTCTRWILKEIQFFYLFRIIEMKLDRINNWVGGTGDCKIRDLSVGLKVVWGKPVKCHRGGRVCKQNLWYKVVWARYLLLIVTKRACGRKEGRKGAESDCFGRTKGFREFTIQEGRGGVSMPAGHIQILFGPKISRPRLYFQSADPWKWSWENEVLSLLNKGRQKEEFQRGMGAWR